MQDKLRPRFAAVRRQNQRDLWLGSKSSRAFAEPSADASSDTDEEIVVFAAWRPKAGTTRCIECVHYQHCAFLLQRHRWLTVSHEYWKLIQWHV